MRCATLLSFLTITAGISAAQQSVVAGAAGDPYRLARALAREGVFDWASLWKTLGWRPELTEPCRGVGSDEPCSVEVIFVAEPEQAIVAVHSHFNGHDVYLRYLRGGDAKWRFSGGVEVPVLSYPRRHEVIRSPGEQFLRISCQGMRGTGVSSEVEEWFALSLPEFKPVFSAVVKGHYDISGQAGLSREFSSTVLPRAGKLHVHLMVDVFVEKWSSRNHFGPIEVEAVFRRAKGNEYVFEDAHLGLGGTRKISAAEYERLTDVDEGPAEEELIGYCLDRLKEIAAEGDSAAKDWLRTNLPRMKATAAVLELRKLLR